MDINVIFSEDRGECLEHYGIPGMKWGVRNADTQRKYSGGNGVRRGTSFRDYKSTSIRSALARRKNKQVDKSFEYWNVQAQKRENAISAGKNANAKKLAYESDPSKESKRAYKQADKEYKQSLKGISTHRKGQVKGDVHADMARKRLAGAKKIEKLLAKDPGNKKLRKEYNKQMSEHDVERVQVAKSRNKYAARSAKKASIKRKATVAAKTAATTAALGVGAYAVAKKTGYKVNTDAILAGARIAKNVSKYL